MLEIALGVGFFTFIVLALVMVILYARAKLVAAGPVRIEINDDPKKTIEVAAGGKLLDVLGEEQVFLPSACGGSGICGLCRVKVKEGGGPVLPTERSFISNKDAAAGYHLACQLAVKQDLKLEIPAEVFGTRRWEGKVATNRSVATFIKELVITLPQGDEMEFKPGSYVQIEAPPHRVKFSDFDIAERFRPAWDNNNLWKLESVVSEPVVRAYSMANYPGEEGGLRFNVRISTPPPASQGIPPGMMSSYLFSLKRGDTLSFSGPYGQFFPKETDAEMIYIGGGSGMAPLRSHIFALLMVQSSRRKISFWYGARSHMEIFYQEEFDTLQIQHPNFDWHVALSDPQPEDQWTGYTGFIHQVLFDNYLADHPAPEDCEYYLCGPPVMLRTAITMLKDLGAEEENILFDDLGG